MTRLAHMLIVASLTVSVHSVSIQAAPDTPPKGSPDVSGDRVRGTVVQVTATAVFIDVGGSQGVESGDRVLISVARPNVQNTRRRGRRGRTKPTEHVEQIEFDVLDVWKSGARCALEADQPIPKVGARVSAKTRPVTPYVRPQGERLPTPRALDDLLTKWNGIDLQRRERIRYGDEPATDGSSDGRIERTSGLLALEYVGLVDPRQGELDNQYHQIALRSDLNIPSLLGGRVDYAHRLRLRYDMSPDLDARPFDTSRSLVRIYRMRAGFHLGGVSGEVGRTMSGPVPDAGLIDGATVRTRVGDNLHVGAWGGLAPRITDLRPAAGSLGFGLYGSFRKTLDNRSKTRISIDGGFLGSTWDGALDRQATAMRASIVDPKRWLHTQLVVDFAAPTRPSVEPSMFVLDAGAQLGSRTRATVHVDHVRSIQTGEALDALPAEYLSTVAFSSIRTGVDIRLSKGLRASVRAGWRMRAEGASSLTSSASVRASGLAFGDDYASIGVDGAFGTYIDGGALRLRYSLPVHRAVDVSAGYRLYGYRYGGENERLFRHQPSLSVDAAFPHRIFTNFDFDAYLGSEQTVLGVFANVAKRF